MIVMMIAITPSLNASRRCLPIRHGRKRDRPRGLEGARGAQYQAVVVAWSDDVQADTESLIADGWTLALAANPPDEGYGRFTYVRSPSGYLVEPVTIAAKPRFERWWAGGSLSDPVPAS